MRVEAFRLRVRVLAVSEPMRAVSYTSHNLQGFVFPGLVILAIMVRVALFVGAHIASGLRHVALFCFAADIMWSHSNCLLAVYAWSSGGTSIVHTRPRPSQLSAGKAKVDASAEENDRHVGCDHWHGTVLQRWVSAVLMQQLVFKLWVPECMSGQRCDIPYGQTQDLRS
jgi:hypothetical protein